MAAAGIDHHVQPRRAGELAAADPAHRARLGRRLELVARSRPEILPCGAPFRHEPETAITHARGIGRPRGHSVRCRAAMRRAVTRKITTASGQGKGGDEPVS